MEIVLLSLGVVGHVVLWVALVNRAHGLGIHRRWVDAMTAFCVLMFCVLPIAVVAALVSVLAPRMTLPITLAYAAARIYIVACAAVCVVAATQRLYWKFHAERRGALASNHTATIDVAAESNESLTAPGFSTLLGRLPLNEVLKLRVQEKQVELPRLSSEFIGLRIVHLSDLHMSGRIAKAFFERVVDEVNECDAALVAITGDIVERTECLDWIPSTLGRLRARGGVYYVLGNHDRRVGKDRLTAALDDAGLIHVSGSPRNFFVGDTRVVLAGNELPWFGPATDLADCPPHDSSGLPVRIALVHSPDRFAWAQANEIDLVLAGHVHGGQVCLPVLGPIVAPSLHGVRYAGGIYRAGNTVMHVSRGTSSFTPIRWNCPPEIAVLNLRPVEGAVL